MNYWLMKTEPEEFSWTTSSRKGAKGEAWTAARNFIARGHIKEQKKGDLRLHLSHRQGEADRRRRRGDQGTLQGFDRREAIFYATDVIAKHPLKTPVTLAAIKADARFKTMPLVKYARLSVQPEPPRLAGRRFASWAA